MTNRWNRFIYRLWAPVYDLFFAHRGFGQARRRALALLDVQQGERVILPGVFDKQKARHLIMRKRVSWMDRTLKVIMRKRVI